MQLKIYTFLLALYCMACNNNDKTKQTSGADTAVMVFDTAKWKTKNGDDHPYRDELLTYLITGNHLKGWKKDSVLTVLGQPDKIDSNYLFYRIAEQRMGAITLHTKTLVIKFNADTVEWRKIHE